MKYDIDSINKRKKNIEIAKKILGVVLIILILLILCFGNIQKQEKLENRREKKKLKKKNEKNNFKIRNILGKVVYIIVVVCMLYNISYLLNTTITKKDYLSIFKMSFLYVESDNMEPELSKNDLIITKETKNELEMDDIIAYVLNGQTRISKITNVEIENGETSYMLKANKNYYQDVVPVKNGQIIGKVICHIPILGNIVKILQTKIVSIIFFAILIFVLFFNRYTYMKSAERRRKKKHIRLGK